MMAPSAIALIVGLVSAALMGLAIQRGATCMVAAVDDALVHRRFGRAGALAEAALWVGGLLAALEFFGFGGMAHARYPVTAATAGGGAVLGLGAWVNRACVFGSVARIGSGHWAWLASPVGFFLGCLAPIPLPQPAGTVSAQGPVLAFCFAALVLLRLAQTARAPNPLMHLWHPHRATLLIAVTFVSTMLAVGAWAYTDALAALARPLPAMDARIALRSAMALALLAGAVAGGRIAGTLPPQRARPADVARCAAGGAIMGAGAQLVPGSNDGLIMLGLPLLFPHAWLAVTAMTLTLAALTAPARGAAGAAAS